MKNVKLTIDGQFLTVEKGTTILQAARKLNIDIPTLCHHEYLSDFSGCRLCIVEITGWNKLPPSCITEVENGMDIYTNSAAVIEARKTILELLLENHPNDCLTCEKSGNCRLQDYAYLYGVRGSANNYQKYHIDDSNPFIVRDPNKCILCGKCVRACREIKGQSILEFTYRSSQTKVTTPLDKPLAETDCVYCHNCVAVCPTGALTDKYLLNKGRWFEFRKAPITCPFCANGCQFYILRKNNKTVGVTPQDITSEYPFCLRGRLALTLLFCEEPPQPEIKTARGFEPVNWEQALGFEDIVKKISEEN